uniref:Uncharacterized protein n=1 Tax=Gracilaria gracilis TaxID=2777 RepID=A0A345U812_GRAGA|nr:hypothetical protein [Gracilaria gracilis]AXI96598.1 hypothetical protein [Gracilaria gracilis]
MYFYQKFKVDSNNYYFFNCQVNYIFVFSFFSYKIISEDCMYLYSLDNYDFSMSSKLFVRVLIFIIILHNSNIILEVRINNFQALSIYYWLGFCIVNIRFYYYTSNDSASSAYSLLNTKFISQNMSRRYLILNIY